MTLDELDDALLQTGLDVKGHPANLELRNKILARHGEDILLAKNMKCKDCWLREHGRCGANCKMHTTSDDPVEVSKEYLSKPNDIQLFPFLCMYMIPVYEESTGEKNMMQKLARGFKQRWIAEMGSAKDLPSFN